MDVRFFLNPQTGLPHIFDHNVSEDEVRDVLRKPLEEFPGRRNSIIAHGQTRNGRYLKLIYSLDPITDGIFVITAYDLSAGQLHALRRRMRRRKQR
jgi:hypothetical protein